MSTALATINGCIKKIKNSYFMLNPSVAPRKKRINDLIKLMSNVEFHFALESISGKGKKFLQECIKEAKVFKNAKMIDSSSTSWSELYSVMRKNEQKIK